MYEEKKRLLEELKERLEDLRGYLWHWKEKREGKRIRRKNSWTFFLGRTTIGSKNIARD